MLVPGAPSAVNYLTSIFCDHRTVLTPLWFSGLVAARRHYRRLPSFVDCYTMFNVTLIPTILLWCCVTNYFRGNTGHYCALAGAILDHHNATFLPLPPLPVHLQLRQSTSTRPHGRRFATAATNCCGGMGHAVARFADGLPCHTSLQTHLNPDLPTRFVLVMIPYGSPCNNTVPSPPPFATTGTLLFIHITIRQPLDQRTLRVRPHTFTRNPPHSHLTLPPPQRPALLPVL